MTTPVRKSGRVRKSKVIYSPPESKRVKTTKTKPKSKRETTTTKPKSKKATIARKTTTTKPKSKKAKPIARKAVKKTKRASKKDDRGGLCMCEYCGFFGSWVVVEAHERAKHSNKIGRNPFLAPSHVTEEIKKTTVGKKTNKNKCNCPERALVRGCLELEKNEGVCCTCMWGDDWYDGCSTCEACLRCLAHATGGVCVCEWCHFKGSWAAVEAHERKEHGRSDDDDDDAHVHTRAHTHTQTHKHTHKHHMRATLA